MKPIDRRGFLKVSSATGIGVMGMNKVWSLTKLEPIGDTLKKDYPYRGWEDIYRKEFEYDSYGYASHCVNCHGNCAFKVFVKDGVVVREEQLAQYPQVSPDIPDTNPRGCQKGAIHSQAMYDSDRIRYPMRRVGKRGEGKWQRISWDQVTEEIADKIIDIYEKYGPGSLMTHSGSGNTTGMRLAAGFRFASLLGGVLDDGMTNVGDGQSGQMLAMGDAIQNFTSDAWFDADYIINSYHNPNVTRIPDAHYLWEAKYNGCRVISVSPDYNPTAIHCDLWINIKPGTDPFMYMSMVNVILNEDLWDKEFVKEQTDLVLLVRDDNGKLLRQNDLQEGGREDVFYFWNNSNSKAMEAPGSMGSAKKTLKLNGANPALEGSFDVNGIKVQPAFVHMKAEAMKFPPEKTQDITGVNASIVRDEARRFAAARKAFVISGFASAKVVNGIYLQWSQVLMCALTGHIGERGGYSSAWTDWGWESHYMLAFPGKKIPRFECGGLGEFMHGKKIKDARLHFDNKKLKERVGFDLDEMEAMLNESIETGQMPVFDGLVGAILIADNKFVRNKGPHYRERLLELFKELLVVVDVRMNSTGQWADYVLPAAAHYEAWDLRVTPLHRFVNFFTAPVRPVGEARPDWEIFVLLTKKIQQRAIARGIKPYQDGSVVRDFTTIYDEFTDNGTLMDAKTVTRWLVEHSPQLQDQTFEEGVEKGFLVMKTSPSPPSAKVSSNSPMHSWKLQVEDKAPYPTLSGRLTFYCDHHWFQKLNSTVPTARHNAGPAASKYPYSFYTPHTRWGIHTTWRSNKYMMRLQRGEPYVYVNPTLAAEKGIKGGGQVRVFNGIGEFFAQAKITPSVPDDVVMMEHAWERNQFKDGKGLNNVVATLIQPLEAVGNWGHLKFSMFRWNPNSLANESAVDIERVD